MGLERYVVDAVVLEGRSPSEIARLHGISRSWLYQLLARYREGGYAALQPRSRRPRSCSHATRPEVEAAIVTLRAELAAAGHDAGPATIAHHLGRRFEGAPSPATVWRILRRRDLITPQPHKRPRSSFVRFEAALPNELWQSDFTHWRLADGTEVEIISWLDDHSRYLLGCTACRRVAGDDVVATFTAAGNAHGWPAATLTDNAAVYTSRFTGGRNDFEYLLAWLGIRQKHGLPGHPQTQGKVDRFQQTLKRWLEHQPAAHTVAELQTQLDTFRSRYNEERPHRAIGRGTPAAAYAAQPRVHPAGRGAPGHFRLRYDTTDKKGAITLRRGGRMHHLRIGAVHAGRRVLAIVDEHEVTVVALDTGELLSTHRIEPDRGYWRNTQRDPGRWPGSQATG